MCCGQGRWGYWGGTKRDKGVKVLAMWIVTAFLFLHIRPILRGK
jgi:hypothetical protein